MSKWKPIETAPKDCCKPILIYRKIEGNGLDSGMNVAYWAQDHWEATNCWIGKDLPTHWMPLPKPPKELS